ncbi:(d)CMP kinase [Lachnoclostridium edouardi]|uniref:(d)CMP kinase n=1 Tax=Lachnoclostridium edouardi TaxID=1926283 RepID=UPI000C7A37E1|nr:(d)CMP kinase [Lachnoclostridium edouardi]
MGKTYNIAIDGPAGAGKSTIAKKVAEKLNFIYVDTGAMYRAMALYFIRQGINRENEKEVEEACGQIEITISYENHSQQVILNGENVSELIRREEVGNMASAVSVYKSVRDKLLLLQRDLAAKENVIMDGRDIGTWVLPWADTKIYLTAGSKVRAERRYKELEEKGISCNIEEIEKDIIERDRRDMTREIAPLRQADDAVLVDASHMTIEEVADRIMEIAADHGLEVKKA